ncbi:MAG: glycosyltransferase family 2 protein, partial [Thermohalobaculum sp.]|nr:glycosyltransferase family 2 protein [Thermohalobaculum sp.]
MTDTGLPDRAPRAPPADLRIAVATVNYCSADLVMTGLPALLAELAGFAAHRVVIVDNASPGDDADRLAAHLATLPGADGVRLVRSPRNGGFAAGNNLAFHALAADGFAPDAVLLLNPDAEVRPGAIREMAAVLRTRPHAGVVGARLEHADGTSWVAAFHFPSLMGEFARETGLSWLARRWPVLAPDTDTPARVDWVSGAAMLIRSEALAALGGMDEGYFLYFEEIDFMRALARRGWETWHAPAARVRHLSGKSTGIVNGRPERGRMPAYWFASWLRYFAKNHGAGYARAAAAAKLAGMLLGDLQRRLRGKPSGRPERFYRDFA